MGDTETKPLKWQRRLFNWASSPTIRLSKWTWNDLILPLLPYIFLIAFVGAAGYGAYSGLKVKKAADAAWDQATFDNGVRNGNQRAVADICAAKVLKVADKILTCK